MMAANQALGAMQFLLPTTTEYLRSRKQFGVPLATFQALTFRAADMYVSLELTHSMVDWATMVVAQADTAGPRRRGRRAAGLAPGQQGRPARRPGGDPAARRHRDDDGVLRRHVHRPPHRARPPARRRRPPPARARRARSRRTRPWTHSTEHVHVKFARGSGSRGGRRNGSGSRGRAAAARHAAPGPRRRDGGLRASPLATWTELLGIPNDTVSGVRLAVVRHHRLEHRGAVALPPAVRRATGRSRWSAWSSTSTAAASPTSSGCRCTSRCRSASTSGSAAACFRPSGCRSVSAATRACARATRAGTTSSSPPSTPATS